MFQFWFVRLAALTAAVVFLGGPALAHDYQVGSLKIGHPWVRPTPPGALAAAGYLTLVNRGASPERLLGGTFQGSQPIEVHRMTMTGQIMRMRPVAGGLAVGPGQTVVLSPGGALHLMLIGPKRPLKAGDQIPATLRFEKAGVVKMTFVVQDPGARTARPMHGMEMH